MALAWFGVLSAGHGIDAYGLPSVLSALGIAFSIAFVCLLLPLVLREPATATEAAVRGRGRLSTPRARWRWPR